MRRNRGGSCRRAFTLVEMIVATVLLFVGVTAVLISIGSATRATGVADEYTRAALLAQQRFAEIAAQPEQLSGGEQQGDFGDSYPGCTWQQNVETTDFPDLARVTLMIQWPSGSSQRTAQFVTYEMTASSEGTQ